MQANPIVHADDHGTRGRDSLLSYLVMIVILDLVFVVVVRVRMRIFHVPRDLDSWHGWADIQPWSDPVYLQLHSLTDNLRLGTVNGGKIRCGLKSPHLR